ncbi:MAG: GTP-binding protein [Deltaproteobacteria bacterium]|jgi:G3E family GTPase|nr:GTP-binding protein [Deltaproteobacteria bacterium]
MSDTTRVYLLTGFLGSGKTTLLNRIIDIFPKDKKLTILINEFGEIGVDGTLIEGEELDMMEISKGSIFCVCVKTDFIKGLYELTTTVQPDFLIIESTGVANPSDLKKDLELPIFNNRFQFMEQFCIIDGVHFLDAFGVYASLDKQIASSTVFIINKTDLSSPETIEETKKVIRQFHPDPFFFETTYADIPLEQFLFPEAAAEAQDDFAPRSPKKPVLSGEELEKFVDDLLDSPDLEITPPDLLMSVTYEWAGDDLEQVRDMAGNLPPSVVRAKGFLSERGETYIFNYVMGDWTIEESKIAKDRIHHMNVVVFIGPPESMEGIEEASKSGDWSNMGTFEPFSRTEDEPIDN